MRTQLSLHYRAAAERANLLTCAFSEAARGGEATFRLASAFNVLPAHDGVWLEGRRLQHTVAALAERTGDLVEVARAQAEVRAFAVTMADLGGARTTFERARLLATELDDGVLRGHVLLGLCGVSVPTASTLADAVSGIAHLHDITLAG